MQGSNPDVYDSFVTERNEVEDLTVLFIGVDFKICIKTLRLPIPIPIPIRVRISSLPRL